MKAWTVVINGHIGVTFAATRGAARMNAVRALWEVCPRRRGDSFPAVYARRRKDLDGMEIKLSYPHLFHSVDYVEMLAKR